MKSIRKTSNGSSITIADRRIYLGMTTYGPDNQFFVGFDSRRDLPGIRRRQESCRECLTHLERELGEIAYNPGHGRVLDLGPAYDCWTASAEFILPFPFDAVRALREGAQFMQPEEIPEDMLTGRIFGSPREGKYSVVLYTDSMDGARLLGKGMERAFLDGRGHNGYIEYIVRHGCVGILEPLIGLPEEWRGRKTPVTNRDPAATQKFYMDTYNMLKEGFY